MSTSPPGDTDWYMTPGSEPTSPATDEYPGNGPESEATIVAPLPSRVVAARPRTARPSRPGHTIEAAIVYAITFAFLALLSPRIATYLSPLTGDEPFYLMTAKSIWEDHDINECNNYRQREEATFYPASVVTSRTLPAGWLGWPSAPYPLPPHPAKIIPESRRCLGSDVKPNYYLPDSSWPLPTDGTQNELYSKHGLGLSLLVMLPYEINGRLLVVLFLNLLGALVAANIYLLARQATGSILVAVLTWLAMSFTVPLLPYSYLIFPELPAALLVIYAFRRLWMGRNNAYQLFLIGLCLAFLPWLHYRFAPISLGLGLFYLLPLLRWRGSGLMPKLRSAVPFFLPAFVSAILLMWYFYFLYRQPFPNGSDHAGISDFAGTLRGMAGSFIDQQWGLLIASPVYILAFVGLVLMLFRASSRRDLLWIGIIALPYFVLISNYAQWWGEWCPPARYLTAILPLLALPFARGLAAMSEVRAALYGLVYTALTSLSFLTTWGFYFQPQWMYNQPNGKSQVLLNGLPSVLAVLPPSLRPHLALVDDLPTFVVPYFAYQLQGKASGDSWAQFAWEKSALPFTVFGVLLGVGLLLALWEWLVTRGRGEPGGFSAEKVYLPPVRREPESSVLAAPFQALFAPLAPALARGIIARVRPQTTELAPPASVAMSSVGSGIIVRPVRHDPHRTDLAGQNLSRPVTAAPKEPAVWLRVVRVGAGLLALALCLFGQKLAMENTVLPAIRWYAAGIVVLFVGWLGSYRNRSALFLPMQRVMTRKADVTSARPSVEQRRTWKWLPVARYLLALFAVGLNLFAVSRLRADRYDSLVGGMGWLVSVILLVVAFMGERVNPAVSLDGPDPDKAHNPMVSRRVEFLLVAGLLVLALVVRIYRLGDWTMGMHGDEGEAGMDALGILQGNMASPFQAGWFEQPNFYYWGVAIGMKIFGTGLFGLRAFSVVFGTALVLPLYALGKEWFGLRVGAIAAFLFAISEVSIHFSRQEFSNITTPFFTCTALYFLFVGLRTRKTVFFLLSAYAAVLTTYFYLGGRLTPLFLLVLLAFIFGVGALLRIPSSYRRSRLREPRSGVARRLLRAIGEQFTLVRGYAKGLALFCVAGFCIGSPFLFYYLDHRALLDARTADKLIFNNVASMQQNYNLTYGPLYVGLRAPRPDDVLPFSPVVFEKTPLSIKLWGEGFWPRAIWDQLARTLSILTYRFDASGVYTYTFNPVTKPLEAVLVILGIAWAILRWRDSRMATLLLWFWLTVIVGGALTIDAPYAARLVGIFPALSLFAAITLDKFAMEITGLTRALKGRLVPLRIAGYGLSFASIVIPLLYLLWQNVADYYGPYKDSYPFALSTGQAVFVRDTNTEAAAQNHPVPRYFSLGAPDVIWGYGVNRFLNNGTPGEDLVNVSGMLPVVDSEERDLVFIVWPQYDQYIPILRQYYPDAEVLPFKYSPKPDAPPLFTSVKISKEQLAARRSVTTTYRPAGGAGVTRLERQFGTRDQPPPGLSYPVAVAWHSGLVAPAFARYRFQVQSPGAAQLEIDGLSVLTTTGGLEPTNGDIILAVGPHDVRLVATVADAQGRVGLTWSAGNSVFAPVAPRYIWNGIGRGLAAEVRPFSNDPFGIPPEDVPGSESPQVTQRRIDGFLGMRSTFSVLSPGSAFNVNWTATLDAPTSGDYLFSINSNGGSYLLIDGNPVVDNREQAPNGEPAKGQVYLNAGSHALILRYNWLNGTGKLEASWTPPGGNPELLGPNVLHTSSGAWHPGTVSEPPGYVLPAEDTPPAAGSNLGTYNIKSTFGAGGDLLDPHGVAVSKGGDIYVGDSGHHRVVVYSPDGRLLRSWGSAPSPGRAPAAEQFEQISDLAVLPDGTVVVLDSSSPLLQVFKPDGTFIKSYNIQGFRLYNPRGVYAAPDGSVYIADTGERRVVRLSPSPDGEPTGEFKVEPGNAPNITALDQPLDVALGPASDTDQPFLYVIDAANRVVVFSLTGEVRKAWQVQTGASNGGSRMAVGSNGAIFITDPDRGRVDILNAGNGSVNYVGARGNAQDQFGVLSGIAVGSDQTIYVVNSDKANIQVLGTLK